MDSQFGQEVKQEALRLEAQGKDPNQIAKILCDKDSKGHNYGIGIILDGKGQPLPSSSTLLEYITAELGLSKNGTYMNSAKIMEDLKQAVLRWQRVPEKHWKQFKVALPSDAGTGAVVTGVAVELMLNPKLKALGIEELGWPAHKSIAKVARVACKEFPLDGVIEGEGILPLYQAGPLNTTGLVRGQDIINARAKSAAQRKTPVVLDRAYPGFEFARLVATESYDTIMRMSYELQIQPFIEHNVSFALAISPTKSFVTFALRPCGLLLLFCPEASQEKEVTGALNATVRARGSSFEHPITRALAKALVKDLPRLEEEHKIALQRLAEAETTWHKLVQGTPIENLYSDKYAGLFRNPNAQEDAAVHVYGEHLYPVFTKTRCRLNATGIPADEQLAKKHVAMFAKYCYEN